MEVVEVFANRFNNLSNDISLVHSTRRDRLMIMSLSYVHHICAHHVEILPTTKSIQG